jgi:hypothetical protein
MGVRVIVGKVLGLRMPDSTTISSSPSNASSRREPLSLAMAYLLE